MPLHLQRMGSMVARHSQWSSCLRVSVILIVFVNSISGLVVEYIVAIDVTRVRFPADAYFSAASRERVTGKRFYIRPSAKAQRTRHFARVV